jgi:hypothetical protein
VNLPKLDPESPRTRVLSEDEIRIFWNGLDLLPQSPTCVDLAAG